MEVPACIRALARMVAEWATLTRASTAPLMFFRICRTGEGWSRWGGRWNRPNKRQGEDTMNLSIEQTLKGGEGGAGGGRDGKMTIGNGSC